MKWNRLFALAGALAIGAAAIAACSDDSGTSVDPPLTPSNVATSVDGTDLSVTWNAVSNADNYRAVVKTTGESDRSETTTDTEALFTGLTGGATYTVQVFAINSDGEAGSAALTVTIDETIIQVAGDILTNTTWTSDRIYVLAQPIFVGADCGPDGAKAGCVEATLTIEPGTTILGKSDVPQGVRGAYLVVSRGSRLVADANANRPDAEKTSKPNPEDVIVFTSDKPMGQRARGDWGGIVINGQAPTNAGAEAQGEGDSGFYGGTDENDDSGILRGVRIEFAGDDVTPTDQLNGLAPQGVGAGTTISYVQVHYNVDDGIEPFGGTVSMDHVVLTGEGDDSLDGTDGYRGFIQFLIAQQRGDNADQGMEISNNGDDGAATPKSTAVVANATMIGSRDTQVTGDIAGSESDDGVQFREGSNYRVYNSIFTGFGNSGFCIESAQAILNAQARMAGTTAPGQTLSAEGLILWNNAGAVDQFCDAFSQSFFNTAAFNNMIADPGLPASAFDAGSMSSPPDVVPAAMPNGYTAFDLSTIGFDANLVEPVDGRTLVDTDYAGAVEPGTAVADAWYTGWTIWSTGGEDSRPNGDGA